MQNPTDDRFVVPQPITRRTVIRGFGALAGFSSLASLIAACGSDSNSSSPTAVATDGGATSDTGTTGETTPQETTGGTTAPAAAVRGGDLIVDVQTEPQGFNPLAFPNAAYAWLTRQIIDTLYWYDDDDNFVPVLAAGPPESTDGMVWTVKLKNGVTYHNGDPFTAEHVAATYLISNTAPTNAWGVRFGDSSTSKRSTLDSEDHTRRAELADPRGARDGPDPAQGLPRGADHGHGHRRVRVDRVGTLELTSS